MTAEQKQKLLESYNDYCEIEFDRTGYESIEEMPVVIPMGYTTSDFGQYEVQVNFDTEKLEWQEYIDGELKIVLKENSIEEFINEIDVLRFDEIVADILYMANEREGGDKYE